MVIYLSSMCSLFSLYPIIYPINLRKAHKRQNRLWALFLAEWVGFEPTVPAKVQTISSRSRYDRFDTTPSINLHISSKTASEKGENWWIELSNTDSLMIPSNACKIKAFQGQTSKNGIRFRVGPLTTTWVHLQKFSAVSAFKRLKRANYRQYYISPPVTGQEIFKK